MGKVEEIKMKIEKLKVQLKDAIAGEATLGKKAPSKKRGVTAAIVASHPKIKPAKGRFEI
jgi:hypothetical protein